jgi:L-alanine-DL-glutamate epimerase-like enolase superfamily enzyme
MIITRIETFPLRIPFRPGNSSAVSAWGPKDQHAVDSLLVEWRFFDLEARILGEALAVKDGRVQVPQGPGLGIDPDPDVIRAYRWNGRP